MLVARESIFTSKYLACQLVIKTHTLMVKFTPSTPRSAELITNQTYKSFVIWFFRFHFVWSSMIVVQLGNRNTTGPCIFHYPKLQVCYVSKLIIEIGFRGKIIPTEWTLSTTCRCIGIYVEKYPTNWMG